MKNKITTFLWFNNNAEEAINYYKDIFKDLEILNISRYGENPHIPAGTVMTINYKLFGQTYTALNGGPIYQFSQAISFVINCEDQSEIDFYWENLGKDGIIQECGWLIDKFGITWQIVPENLTELLSPQEPEKAQRVMRELWKMKKIEINKLLNA